MVRKQSPLPKVEGAPSIWYDGGGRGWSDMTGLSADNRRGSISCLGESLSHVWRHP
jgi:hypothetical protein